MESKMFMSDESFNARMAVIVQIFENSSPDPEYVPPVTGGNHQRYSFEKLTETACKVLKGTSEDE